MTSSVRRPTGAGKARILERFKRCSEPHSDWISSAEAFELINIAVWRMRGKEEGLFGEPDPDAADCLAGLAQLHDARQLVDLGELEVINYARELGVTWEQIGLALGYRGRSARQAALARHAALTKRFPTATRETSG